MLPTGYSSKDPRYINIQYFLTLIFSFRGNLHPGGFPRLPLKARWHTQQLPRRTCSVLRIFSIFCATYRAFLTLKRTEWRVQTVEWMDGCVCLTSVRKAHCGRHSTAVVAIDVSSIEILAKTGEYRGIVSAYCNPEEGSPHLCQNFAFLPAPSWWLFKQRAQ